MNSAKWLWVTRLKDNVWRTIHLMRYETTLSRVNHLFRSWDWSWCKSYCDIISGRCIQVMHVMEIHEERSTTRFFFYCLLFCLNFLHTTRFIRLWQCGWKNSWRFQSFERPKSVFKVFTIAMKLGGRLSSTAAAGVILHEPMILVFLAVGRSDVYLISGRDQNMMTSSNWNIIRVTGHRWLPPTKASDADLWCFLWSAPE